MNKQIYRDYDIQGPSQTGRYYIFLNGIEVYSMTSTEEQVFEWVDKEKRKKSAGT